LAADQLPVKAAPAADTSGWYSNGTIEAGTNIWIKKPGDGYGRTSSDPFWLTPTTTDSRAKMDEYGKVPRSVFLQEFGFQAGSRDGRYAVDFWADNVGMDNQRYYLGVYEPGRQYFNMGWDQTPHLLSSSAKSIFGGVGTTRLTVDPTLRTNLQANLVNATAGAPNGPIARNNIEGFVDNAETNIELKTLREKFTVGYRNTMLADWDFNVDYSHEHRTGTRPLGIGWGFGTTANPRPSTGSIEVPQPIDDRTQNLNGAGEYSGNTPWGTRWNTSLKYTGSFFDNSTKLIDVDNPFCSTCSVTGGGGTNFGPSTLRYGLAPSNSANGATWNTAVDLPFWKSRYVSALQYTMFRQNDTFLSDAGINGITVGPAANQLNPYPAASLNGAVNAFLTNNVLTSHITKDVSNTARVRYYDRKDNTPTLVFSNYAYADGGFQAATPSTLATREPHSYSKTNLEDELKWQANRTWAFGVGAFVERFVFENGEVDSTNEPGAKAFVNMTTRLATMRTSLEYSQRRYNTYLATTSTDPAAQAQRYFFVANRNRTKGNTVVELAAFKNVTISPNGGFRWDEYPGDRVFSRNAASALVAPLTDSLCTKYDRSWNLGTDVSFRVRPELRLTFGYNHEEHYLRLQECCGGGAATNPFNDTNKWASDIRQQYNTYMVSSDWKAIPGKLDFKADYLAALSREANQTTPCTAPGTNGNNCNGIGTSGVTASQIQFPDEHNLFQRFNLVAKYYVDKDYVRQMGWFGEVTFKARYTWERNHNSNWATDNFSPYSPSQNDPGGLDSTNGGRSLFLAYNNPNYQAQIIALSVATKW
jgi:MtrB/PioB family decaheme-associated outer membrane protein